VVKAKNSVKNGCVVFVSVFRKCGRVGWGVNRIKRVANVAMMRFWISKGLKLRMKRRMTPIYWR
jgi:hypothetical protein